MPSLKFILFFFIAASIAACTSPKAESRKEDQPIEKIATNTKDKAEDKEEAKEGKLTDTAPIETPKVAVATVKKDKNIEKKKEERRDSPFDNSDKYTLDPFGPGAKGAGGSFGNDDGGYRSDEGTEIKVNLNPSRIRLSDPTFEKIDTDKDIVIVLKVTINAAGDVLFATSTAKTTTADTRIINKVITAVKNQVKYNETPGAELEAQFLTLKIRGFSKEE